MAEIYPEYKEIHDLVATGGEAAVRHWCQRTLRDRTEGAGESGLIRRSGLEGTFARLYACHPDP